MASTSKRTWTMQAEMATVITSALGSFILQFSKLPKYFIANEHLVILSPEWKQYFGTVWHELVKRAIATNNFKKPFSPKLLLCTNSSGNHSLAVLAHIVFLLLVQLQSKQAASDSYREPKLSYYFIGGMDVPALLLLLSMILFGEGFILVICASGQENTSLWSSWG